MGVIDAMTLYEKQQGREIDEVERHVFRTAYAMGVMDHQSENAAHIDNLKDEATALKRTLGLPIATHLRSGQGLAVQCVFTDYRVAQKFQAAIEEAKTAVEPCKHPKARCVYDSDDGEFERWACPDCGERWGVEIAQ